MSNAEKLKALKLTIDKIDKDFGKGSVMMMGDKPEQQMEVVSTGSIGLDIALGVGGIPKGRIVEIYGPESSGKTTIATHIIAFDEPGNANWFQGNYQDYHNYMVETKGKTPEVKYKHKKLI
jgi:RecA/RadA recombinase